MIRKAKEDQKTADDGQRRRAQIEEDRKFAEWLQKMADEGMLT